MLDKTAIITSIMVSILQIKYRDNLFNDENIDLLKYWYPNTEIKAIGGI